MSTILKVLHVRNKIDYWQHSSGSKGESSLDIKFYINAFVKRFWIIVAFVIISVIVSLYISSYLLVPLYESSASLYVSQDEAVAGTLYTNIMGEQMLAKSYKELIVSQSVILEVLEELGYSDLDAKSLASSISADVKNNTSLIVISVRNSSPIRAKEITEKLVEVFMEKATHFAGNGSLTLLDNAQLPEHPAYPNVKNNTAIALLAAIIISCLIILVLEFFDDSIKDPVIAERMTKLDFIGFITDKQNDNAYKAVVSKIILHATSKSAKLFTVLGFESSDENGSIASNTAMILTDSNFKVLLVDCDFKNPQIHKHFFGVELKSFDGMEFNKLKQFVQRSKLTDNLDILTFENKKTGSLKLISSIEFDSFLKESKSQYDFIIISTPPLKYSIESSVIPSMVDGVFIVAKSNVTKQAQMAELISSLKKFDSEILGFVINKARKLPNKSKKKGQLDSTSSLLNTKA